MRKVSKTEQEKEEITLADRADRRRVGYALMGARDAGSFRLSNGVIMRWPAPDQRVSIGNDVYLVVPNGVPEGHFKLTVGGRDFTFEAEEFRRYLRWV